jgi:hypothetical protein
MERHLGPHRKKAIPWMVSPQATVNKTNRRTPAMVKFGDLRPLASIRTDAALLVHSSADGRPIVCY